MEKLAFLTAGAQRRSSKRRCPAKHPAGLAGVSRTSSRTWQAKEGKNKAAFPAEKRTVEEQTQGTTAEGGAARSVCASLLKAGWDSQDSSGDVVNHLETTPLTRFCLIFLEYKVGSELKVSIFFWIILIPLRYCFYVYPSLLVVKEIVRAT